MAHNQYHLLYRIPAVEPWEMPPALEALAQRILVSGQLRIHADYERNFVRFGTADSDKTFTARELTDPLLLPRTRAELARHVPASAGPEAVEELLARLHIELKKARGVDSAKEAKVARVLVQSAHPCVIALLLQSGTSVFVSYSHNVADLLAVHEWGSHGDAGGLQATSAEGTAVYISCGGDPFFAGEQKTYATDGFPALARMMVIGGQELGHFADLWRENGQIIGRYSTDNSAPLLRASGLVKTARRGDMLHLGKRRLAVQKAGISALARAEAAVAFYEKRRLRFSPPWLACQSWRALLRLLFLIKCRRAGIALRLRVHPRLRHGTAYQTYLSDMAFNLSPDAEAYRRADPEAEEAIACIEALARVPQQVHKWGHRAVAAAWPQLYDVYYGTVIPGCIRAAGTEGAKQDISIIRHMVIWFRGRVRRRPQYYP